MSNAIPVFNPSNEEQIAEVPDSDQAAVDAAVARARETFESGVWRKAPASHRANVLFRARAHHRGTHRGARRTRGSRQRNEHHRRATHHHGGERHPELLRRLGRQDPRRVQRMSCPTVCLAAGRRYHTFTQLEPIGVVGLIIPWNGPFFVAMLKVAPALAAGCSAVLKPAEETPLTALKLEEIFREAGLPDGVLNVVTGYGETTGAALTAHPGRRQDLVHRIHGGRTADRQGGRGQPQAADPRARRQVTADHVRRRQSRQGDHGCRHGPAGRLGAELLLHIAHLRPARRLRTGRRGPRRLRQDDADGRQRGPQLRHRTADQREAAPTRARHRRTTASPVARR